MISQNIRLFSILSVAVFLLLIPLVAMQFTNEVIWSGFDFLVAGLLLLGTGIGVEYVLRKVKQTKKRVVICIAILFTLLLVWAELAVGIFGSPFAGS